MLIKEKIAICFQYNKKKMFQNRKKNIWISSCRIAENVMKYKEKLNKEI